MKKRRRYFAKRNGNRVEVNRQIILWRQRRKRFEELKPKLEDLLLEHFNGDAAAVVSWFKTPHPELNNKAPVNLFTLPSAKRLYVFVARMVREAKEAKNALNEI